MKRRELTMTDDISPAYHCLDCGEMFRDTYDASDHGNAGHHVVWHPFRVCPEHGSFSLSVYPDGHVYCNLCERGS